MKKRIAALMMVMMVMVSVLAGCGKKVSAIVGNWNCVSVEVGGVSMDMKQMAEQQQVDPETIKITAAFTEDKKFSMELMTEKTEGTWEEKDGKFTLTVDGEAMEATITDGKLVFADEATGMKITFEKAK